MNVQRLRDNESIRALLFHAEMIALENSFCLFLRPVNHDGYMREEEELKGKWLLF